MKEVLPAFVAIAYFLVAIDYFRVDQYGWSLAWFSYALANAGLIMASKGI